MRMKLTWEIPKRKEKGGERFRCWDAGWYKKNQGVKSCCGFMENGVKWEEKMSSINTQRREKDEG